ncbi:tyrosine-type recombinase/integrase [Paracoccus aerodenitrificans]|uniref:tyrosine-type recombinase/integrase n=1 Tax=Paracoccus aerodenitrificans TaxID=3017781 RepID=UPI0022F00A21|nr:tyrosine-type recombinase/integrase [Paracoccus aerodenitrificans]WBU64567.1 tyrosine-type recombinase/integrase [Paracoccus aerodenitrificans]
MKHLNPSGRFPSGNVRFYYRPRGQKGIAMPDLPPYHPRFIEANYEAAGTDEPLRPRAGSGSLALVVEGYLKSDAFLVGLAKGTRTVRRRMLDEIRARYGHGRVIYLRTKHVEVDLSRFSGHARNNHLKTWRGFGKWLAETYNITDPTAGAKKAPVAQSDGIAPWSEDEIETYRSHWPIGTRERLAFELIFWTGARISDAVRPGQGNVDRDGWIVFRQQKTGGEVAIPFDRALPDFAYGMETDLTFLHAALKARNERHITWMTTFHGKSRSVKAAGQWFAAKARAAGVRGRSAHGLRKSRARALAEAEATSAQIGAWTGHESLSEIERYIRHFNKRKVLSSTKVGQKVPTYPTEVPTLPKKSGETNA